MSEPLPPHLAALQKAFGDIFETVRVTDAATGKQTVFLRNKSDRANPKNSEDGQ
jgi:hypothetical protein